MKGSITELNKKQAWGFILGEDGCELYFDQVGLNGVEIRTLCLGQWG
jgi:hypothetical protein